MSPETRDRLLEAAGEAFAEHGFRAATVRDICDRAGANVAAVNYYFGDKEKLYEEVLRFAHRRGAEKFPTTGTPGASPEEQLSQYIHAFLRRILDTGRPTWPGRLMAREMVEPTAALDRIVSESIGPQSKELEQIVRSLLGKADESAVQYIMLSIVGQCVFYRHCEPVIIRLMPGWTAGPAEIERLADHVTRFSLAAIQALAHPRRKS
jgi:AcrR family transcriptional regulator